MTHCSEQPQTEVPRPVTQAAKGGDASQALGKGGPPNPTGTPAPTTIILYLSRPLR